VKTIRALLLLSVALSLPSIATGGPDPAKIIAVTIDDLPFVGYGLGLGETAAYTDRLLQPLAGRNIQAVGFVNERNVLIPGEMDARTGLLKKWIDRGMILGNHTFSHLDSNATSLQEYEADIIRGGTVTGILQKASAGAPRYFRHPMNHRGKTPEYRAAVDQFLAAAGYSAVPFTIENSDYLFAYVYAAAVKAGDRELAGRVMRAYLEFTEVICGWMEQQAAEAFGRPIPHVLLIHANALNSDGLDALLDLLEKRGYAFAPLGRVMSDPAYQTPDGYTGAAGPSWIYRWQLSLGKPSGLKGEPEPPEWIVREFEARRKASAVRRPEGSSGLS
jgi:peptidoglycan/xylan/chitin deacetylase (PgdA/CDA1 family)